MLRRVMVGSAIAAAGWYVFDGMRRWYQTWGVDREEGARSLPGDDLVSEPTLADTRGLTVEAPPALVWPWLVQLGYGRGGWYSYDRLDMEGRSADRILPQFQALAVGDIVPTDPRGGFEVRVLEPEHALVLLIDQEIAARQRAPGPTAGAPAGIQASDRFMAAAMPPAFAASWAVVLEPLEGGRTRLIERVRGRFPATTRGSRALGPVFGFVMFIMERSQMLGIARRAERLAREDWRDRDTWEPGRPSTVPA